MELSGRCRLLKRMLMITLICCSVTCYTWHILSNHPLVSDDQPDENAYAVKIWFPRRIKSGPPYSNQDEPSRTTNNTSDPSRTSDQDTRSHGSSRTLDHDTRSHSSSRTSDIENKSFGISRTSDFDGRSYASSITSDLESRSYVPSRTLDPESRSYDPSKTFDLQFRSSRILDSRYYGSPRTSDPINKSSSGETMVRLWGAGGAQKRLPQALIIGVKKCGTRALLEFLRLHPDIRATGPETHFFDRFYDKGLEWYRQQMPQSLESQITMEKTPSYFITREVPRRLHQMSPSVKLIVVVRDPVTRAISDYTQTASKKNPFSNSPTFDAMTFRNSSTGLVDTSWSAIRIGVYSRFLDWWTRFFRMGQIHFVSGENLIRDPAGEMALVQDFLGLKRVITDKHFYFNETKGFPCLKKSEGNGNPHCLGKTKGRTHPEISPSTITRLRDFYRPFNLKFYQMVGRDFGWL